MKTVTSGMYDNNDFLDTSVKILESHLAHVSHNIKDIFSKLDQIKIAPEDHPLNRRSSYEEISASLEFELGQLRMYMGEFLG